MKPTLIALALALVVFGITPMVSAETIFDNNSYIGGEAGLIAPLDREAQENVTVTVPMAVFDGNYWYRFEEQKDTNLSGPAPDFNRDYLVGEGGLVNPIDSHMER